MHFHPLNYHIYDDDLPLPAATSFQSQLCSHDFCSRLHSSFLKGQKNFEQAFGADISGIGMQGSLEAIAAT